MNILLLFLALFPRPQVGPIGQSEVAAAQRMLSAERSGTRFPVSACPSAWDSPDEVRVPGRFVIGFNSGKADAVASWVGEQGGGIVRVDEASGFVVADLPPCSESPTGRWDLSASRTAAIRYLEPSIRATVAGIPNDPYFIPYQWDKWVMYADQAWDVVGGSMDVKVAVVDCGVDWQHPDLAANFKTGELGYDFIGNDNDPRPDDPGIPESFHGTHVAGIIAATRNNGQGVAGWSLVQLLSLRVLNDSGSGTTDVVASGIRWAADHGARVINMSLTSSSSSTPMEEACAHAESLGVVVVAASGNEGQQAIGYPAALSQCIAVGASSADSRLASFSNYGPEQEVVAPGTTILSCVPGGAYGQADGTSMAAPQVAGVAALLLARNWGLNASEVRAAIDASAVDMGAAGRDVQYGYGLVNAKRALELAAALRAPQVVAAEPPSSDAGTLILRRGRGLRSWLDRADVYDGSGRRVQTGRSSLGPGTYFVRTSSESRVSRLLVLD